MLSYRYDDCGCLDRIWYASRPQEPEDVEIIIPLNQELPKLGDSMRMNDGRKAYLVKLEFATPTGYSCLMGYVMPDYRAIATYRVFTEIV